MSSDNTASMLVYLSDEKINARVIQLNKMFKTFNLDMMSAMRSVMSRTTTTAQAESNRAVPKHYNLTSAKFRKYSGFTPKGVKSSSDMVMISFEYRGNVIPIREYSTSVSGKDVSAAIKKGSGMKSIPDVFQANFYGKPAIWERYSRKKIRQIFGPSAASLMKNEKVYEQVEDKVIDVLIRRMDHEFLRLLKGL